MKTLALLFPLLFLQAAHTFAADPPAPSLHVPTTRVLAIGRLEHPLSPEERKTIMSREVTGTVKLYLNGKIDQWWIREDGKGVVFLMNVTSEAEAHNLLEQLPLGQAKLMQFDFLALGPLSPLNYLLK